MRRKVVAIALISLAVGGGPLASRAWGQAPVISPGEPYSGTLQGDTELAIVVFEDDKGGEWNVQVESPAFTPWIRVFRVGGSGDEEFIGGALALSAYEPALMLLGAGEGTRYRIEVRSLYETWGGPFEVLIRPRGENAPGSQRLLDETMQWVAEFAESSGDPILLARAEIASILPPAIPEEASVPDLMRQFPGNQLLGLWDPRWGRLRLQFELVERFRENKQKTLDAIAMYESVLGPNHLAIAATRLQLSRAVWKTGEVEEAGDLINQALAQLEDTVDREHPLLGQAVLSRGRWLRKVGALAESRPSLERARSIFEHGVGERSVAVSYSLEELGSLEWDRSDFEAAAYVLELALEIRQEILGPEDLRLLSVLKRLGVAQIAQAVTMEESEPKQDMGTQERASLASQDPTTRDEQKKEQKKRKKGVGPRPIPTLESAQPTFVHIVRLTAGETRSTLQLDRSWALSVLVSAEGSLPQWNEASASARRAAKDQLSLSGSYPSMRSRADHVSTWEPRLYLDAQKVYERGAAASPALDPSRDLAQSLLRGGELRQSRELLDQVSLGAESELGPDHLEVKIARAELANQRWRSEGNLPVLADTMEESLEVLSKRLGAESVPVALVATDLAMMKAEMGQYQEATALAFQARWILSFQLSPTSPIIARYFPRLAWTFREARMLQEMEATLLAAPSDESLSICTALHLNKNLMLADLRVREGDLETARALVKAEVDRCGSQGALGKSLRPLQDILEEDYEAREGRRKAKGLDDLHNKGKKKRNRALLWGGAFVVAAPLALISLALVSLGGATVAGVAATAGLTLTAAGSPYMLGKSLADPSYKLAPVLDPAREAGYYQVVGAVLQDSGYYSEAAALQRGAIKGMEKGAAKGHPRLSGLYGDLAEALWDSSGRTEGKIAGKDQKLALEAAQQSAEILDTFLHEALSVLPEQQALNLISSRPHPESILFSGLLHASNQRDRWSQAAWNWTLRKRSLVLDELAYRHQQGLESSSPESAQAWQDFVEARRRLAALWIRGPQAGYTHWPELEEALQSREEAEETLAATSSSFRLSQEYRKLDPAEVARALPPRSALVEYVKVPVRPPGPTEYSDHYIALILDHDGSTRHADLGPAAEIDELVRTWLQGLRDSYEAPNSGSQVGLIGEGPSGQELRSKVWDPILAQLAGVDLVFVVLDGSLNQVHFPALPKAAGGFVIDDAVGVHVLSSGRDLVRIRELVKTESTGMLAMGNPDFDSLAPSPSARPDKPATYRGPQARCGALRNHQWSSLPESELEVERIASLYESHDSVTVFTGATATEEHLKLEAPGKKYLHLATHGFFLEGDCPSVESFSRGIGRLVLDSESAASVGEPDAAASAVAFGENPLLLSGLVLAGANRATEVGDDAEDGILTAEEITALDLRGLEVAALSACDTGLGTVAAGEGVFGLRRALEIAGARTVLMSLWSVPDEAGREWMTRFYEFNLAGDSVQQASHKASLELLELLRQEKEPPHPYLWAGFVTAGDWH